MSDLDENLLAAWERVKPKLLSDPTELARRVARRRTPTLTRPPRAMCLAVRASDTRINPATAAIVPEHAVSPIGAPHVTDRNAPARYLPHDVTVDARLIRKLCAPVNIMPPGEPWDEVARRLGVSRLSLYLRRVNGVFRTRHICLLFGRPGRAVPLLYSDLPLDPNAQSFAPPDLVFAAASHNLWDRVPHDFEQTLTRLPVYGPSSDICRRLDATHPEAAEPREPRRDLRRLPAPARDFVWYKWQGDRYVWNDRRRKSVPTHLRPTRRSRAGGSAEFRGWYWRCPICARGVRIVYLPIAHKSKIVEDLTRELPELEIPAIAPAIVGFACQLCHDVRACSRVSKDFWNDLVSYLSGGLLFGSEVPEPDWLTKTRKRPYVPRATRAPSRRRPQVMELLLHGFTYDQIAAQLNLSPRTINDYASKVYGQHRVHGRVDLARKLGRPIPPPPPRKYPEVRHRLALGRSRAQIAREMGITRSAVAHHVCVLNKKRLNPCAKQSESNDRPSRRRSVLRKK